MADPHNPSLNAPAAEMDRRMFLTAAAVTLPLVSSASAQSPTGAVHAPQSNMVWACPELVDTGSAFA